MVYKNNNAVDYSIAFILPNQLISNTISRYLSAIHRNYYVETTSFDHALERAGRLVQMGTKVIVSMGVSLDVLKGSMSIPVLNLSFSEKEILVAVQTALENSERTVQLGTDEMYHYIQKALETLGLPSDKIEHRTFDATRGYDEQVRQVLDEGFDSVIGGSRTVRLAYEHGVKGVEFSIDEFMIENTLINATLIRDFQLMQERNQKFTEAMMCCCTEGLVTLDSNNSIIMINDAAAEIFRDLPDNLKHRDFDALMTEKRLIDMGELHNGSCETQNKEDFVILHREPVRLNDTSEGEAICIRKIEDIESLNHQIQKDLTHKGYRAKYTLDNIAGKSKAVESAKRMVRRYAKYDSTVLITGETGTGKELFAQSIHNESGRKNGPFVAVNCASFPENLIESELFGYDKGAFTGASKEGRAGLLEKASGGSLFMDEISELPLKLQPKLLRVIQEREIVRVGGSKVIPVDVRFIFSSNKDLNRQMETGCFMPDLYYRISVLELNIPPLRMRKDDIGVLVSVFIRENNRRFNMECRGISPGALAFLEKMPWYGNVRELRNVIERTMVLMSSDVISEEDVYITAAPSEQTGSMPFERSAAQGTMKDYEKRLIEETLRRCNGNRAEAARRLGISQTTIWRRLKE